MACLPHAIWVCLALSAGLCVSAQSEVPASQCYVPATASAAGSVGATPCHNRGQQPYCCSDSTCVPDTSGSTYGGGCTSGKAGCCPASSPSPATPTPPASSSPAQVSAGQCDVITTASAAGSFGAAGCKGRGSPYCCSSAAADGTCVPDNSGNQYGGGCTSGKAACCPASSAPSPPATLSPTPPATSSPGTSTCKTTVAGYGQCGGKSNCPSNVTCADAKWPENCCASGFTCTKGNEWYYQCTPN
ncbi:hypothetical protein WJX74_007002 [Apatococcus lobatus]|uniref:CBM1 domain-containing protein n=1 Tax=Apatococcus lobatus TaxID=904363 RepID=A0AAW1R1A3_9CHLO